MSWIRTASTKELRDLVKTTLPHDDYMEIERELHRRNKRREKRGIVKG